MPRYDYEGHKKNIDALLETWKNDPEQAIRDMPGQFIGYLGDDGVLRSAEEAGIFHVDPRVADVLEAIPSANRLREIANTLDFLDKLAVWTAHRENITMGQPGTKMQRELRKLADAIDNLMGGK
jgi:hypothetical protein